MKKVIATVIILVIAALIGYTLNRNKQEFAEQASFADRQVEVLLVQVENVTRGTLRSVIAGYGNLNANKELRVIAEAKGKVVRIFKNPGDWVQKGSIIIQVDDELLQAQMVLVKANYEKAKKDLDRFRKLAEGDATTPFQVEQLELKLKDAESKYLTVKKHLENSKVVAPFSGIINRFYVEEGGLLGPGAPAFEITDISSFKLKIDVSEEEIFQITKGQTVEVFTKIYPDTTFFGVVNYVGVKTNRSKRYPIEISILNNDSKPLRAGMFVNVKIVQEEINTLLVPSSAIINQETLFVIENDKAMERKVTLGGRQGDFQSVKSGVDEGEAVIVAGHHKLNSGQTIKVVNP